MTTSLFSTRLRNRLRLRLAFRSVAGSPATLHRPAVFRPAQCANRANNRGIQSEPVPAITRLVKVEALNSCWRTAPAKYASPFPSFATAFRVQQMQEVTADGVVIGFRLDASPLWL